VRGRACETSVGVETSDGDAVRGARATEAQVAAWAEMAAAELETAVELDANECVVCEPEAISAFEGVGECMGPVG
jgi:hypothetical protein